MVRSMTGFGAAAERSGEYIVTVEARSVNHKFCDVRVRLARELNGLEYELEAAVRAAVNRGRIELSVDLSDGSAGGGAPTANLALAKAYAGALQEIATAIGAEVHDPVGLIAAFPHVIEAQQPSAADPELVATAKKAVASAIQALQSMRAAEGEALAHELQRLLDDVGKHVAGIRTALPGVEQKRRDRMESRLKTLLDDHELDGARLAQELALQADKADITEELARLEIHLQQFQSVLTNKGPVGRKLDFILQEVNRETNTIGSKCAAIEVAHLVVDLKSDTEKLREQIQNVE